MATLGTSLQFLDSANFRLPHNASMQEVNDALAACNTTLEDWNKGTNGNLPMTVYPAAVVYDSVKSRNSAWELYLERNPNTAAESDKADWEAEQRAFDVIGNMATVANQRYFTVYIVSMQNPVYAHSWAKRYEGQDTPELREHFRTGDNEWHEFALVLNQRQVHIYDPSLDYDSLLAHPNQSRPNLKSIPLIGTKAYKVITAMKNRTGRELHIDAVWVGGGGNTTGECRSMSLEWIRAGVEEMVTQEKWSYRDQLKWVQVNLA